MEKSKFITYVLKREKKKSIQMQKKLFRFRQQKLQTIQQIQNKVVKFNRSSAVSYYVSGGPNSTFDKLSSFYFKTTVIANILFFFVLILVFPKPSTSHYCQPCHFLHAIQCWASFSFFVDMEGYIIFGGFVISYKPHDFLFSLHCVFV